MISITQEQFLNSDAGVHAKHELRLMVASPEYKTLAAYDPIVGRKLAFIERHISYLTHHPYVNVASYLANLRVMTRVNR